MKTNDKNPRSSTRGKRVENNKTMRNRIREKLSEVKQYPERPGYHGTDDEKNLNPEE